MTAFDVTVRLDRDPNFRSYNPESVFDSVAFFRVDGESPEAAAETVFAITNSYPGELHCPARYADVVQTYRDNHNRSLSVGDLVELATPDGTQLYAVAPMGFELVPPAADVAHTHPNGVLCSPEWCGGGQ